MRRVLLAVLVLAPLAAPVRAQVDFFAIRKSFALYGAVYETLASEYVDAIDAEALMRSGIGAMTGSLDPYTVYYDEATAAASRLQQGGDVGGEGGQPIGPQRPCFSVDQKGRADLDDDAARVA